MLIFQGPKEKRYLVGVVLGFIIRRSPWRGRFSECPRVYKSIESGTALRLEIPEPARWLNLLAARFGEALQRD